MWPLVKKYCAKKRKRLQVVNDTDYPDGLHVFIYETPERVVAFDLNHPGDGGPPIGLCALRDEIRQTLESFQEKGVADAFLKKYLSALEDIIAGRDGVRYSPDLPSSRTYCKR